MKPKRRMHGTLNTWVAIDGHEHDVLVHYRISPSEPDVGWPGGLDLEGAYYEGDGCIRATR